MWCWGTFGGCRQCFWASIEVRICSDYLRLRFPCNWGHWGWQSLWHLRQLLKESLQHPSQWVEDLVSHLDVGEEASRAQFQWLGCFLHCCYNTWSSRHFLAYKEWSPINVEDMKEVESYQTQWMEVITTIKEGSNLLKIIIQIARRKKKMKNMLRTSLRQRQFLS